MGKTKAFAPIDQYRGEVGEVAKRGRKEVKATVPMALWLMVELTRDRRHWGRPRASVREAAHRLAEELAECFQGGRVLPPETVRDHYKQFQRVMRKNGDEAEYAKRLLENARQRRILLGWDTSIWCLVFSPFALEELGFEATLTTKMNCSPTN
jgi:hypothetical protein